MRRTRKNLDNERERRQNPLLKILRSTIERNTYIPSQEYKTKPKLDSKASPFDTQASAYDAWFDREGKLPFAIEVRAFQEILSSLPKPWLEIGVGSGRFAQALGIRTGTDPSIKLAEMARKRGITVLLGKGEQRLFDKESFGTVFLVVTLCFVNSPLDVLKEAHRILMHAGKMVLGLVLRESPWGRLYKQKKKQGHSFYKYATFYGFDEVASMLEQTGFSIVGVVSTLFQKPNRVEYMELPREGFYPGAGFTIIVAEKCTGKGVLARSTRRLRRES